ncbi:MAG: cell division protein FtsL [Roseiflexaceae bacterium]|nr:cell division protein FtsL [Roseiflexaceae bacterium]
MAINWRKQMPLQQARVTRLQLPRYLQLDGGRYLIAAALILASLSLLSLGQTGRLATRGYELGQLESYKIELQRQQSRLQLELAEAQSLTRIQARAEELGLRPITPDQVRYVTIAQEATESAGGE